MRELQLWGADDLADNFADIGALAEGCKFRDCRHDREPGCAVKRAVEDGALDPGRYEGYLKLQAEQASLERRVEEARRLGKQGSRALKALYKDREKNR
jgi:ribosome biogenesis GTPase